MTTDELEALIEGGEETDSLEFKGAMTWDVRTLVRDILAMANVIDGGRIVIGVEDETFVRQGLLEDQVQSYNLDIMRDQVAPYADPNVQFRCAIVTGQDGLRFAVIDVASFETVPVLCRRDGPDVNRGDIYFRSRSGRPSSARVNNSSDMRDIIEAATMRSARRLGRLGFVANSATVHPIAEPFDAVQLYDYDAELGDLR